MSRIPLRFICLMLVAAAAKANAQVVTGKVVDGADQKPIASALVSVLQNDATKQVVTDEDGNFRIFLREGTFGLRVNALGFGDLDIANLAIEHLQRLTLTLTLGVRPVEVAPVVVVSRRPQSRLGREGLTWRKDRADKSGMGRVLDADAIARLRAMFVSDVIRRQPFMNRSFAIPWRSPMVGFIGRNSPFDQYGAPAVGLTSLSSVPYGANMGPMGPCGEDGFAYFINGTRTRLSMYELDGILSPDHLDGIEIYRRAMEVPGEFGGGAWGCGVIAVWTKR